jgi:hypothetical protein
MAFFFDVGFELRQRIVRRREGGRGGLILDDRHRPFCLTVMKYQRGNFTMARKIVWLSVTS